MLRKKIAIWVLTIQILQLFAPFVQPAHAKTPPQITMADEGNAMFKLIDRNFKVEFGDKTDQTKPKVRFEAIPKVSENMPSEATSSAEVKENLKDRPFLTKAKDFVKKVFRKEDRFGIEFSLVEAGIKDASLINADQNADQRGNLQRNSALDSALFSDEGTLSPLQQGVMDNINAQLEDIAQHSASISAKLEDIEEKVYGIVTDSRQIYAKTELISSSRNNAEFNAEQRGKNTVINREVVPGIDVQYEIIDGKGVKEEIILKKNEGFNEECIQRLSASDSASFSECQLPKNTYKFLLTLDPGVQINQSLTSTKKHHSGSFYFTDKYGRYLGHFLPPFAKDAENNRTNNVTIDITSFNNHLKSSFNKSNIYQKKGDYSQTKSNLSSNINIHKNIINISSFCFHNFPYFFNSNATTKANIASNKLVVNIQRLARLAGLETIGKISTAPNQPADKLTNKSETIFNKIGSAFSIKNSLAKLFPIIKPVYAEENLDIGHSVGALRAMPDAQPEGDARIAPTNYTLTVSVDLKWLLDPSRVYPIRIDPSIVHDTEAEFDTADALNRVESISGPKVQTNYHELPADEHTVGLWHMNNVWTDSSGNGNNGTAQGDATFTTSAKLGSHAGTFDGTGDYVDCGGSSSLDITGSAFSVSVWFKTSAGKTYQRFVNQWETSPSNNTRYVFGFDDAVTKLRLVGATTYTYTHSSSLQDGNWHHAVAVYDGSSTVSIYVDGILGGGGTYVPSSTGTVANTFIGMSPTQSDATAFNGQIDEVRISNRALTPEEIKANAQRRPYGVYTSDVLDLTSDVQSIDSLQWTENGVQTSDGETLYSSTDLVAQWNFNETSGTTADNAEGTAAYDGTVTNMTTTGQDDAAGDGWTVNNARWPRSNPAALMFDGTDGFVDVGDISGAGTIKTVEFWMKTEDIATNNIIDIDGTDYIQVDANGELSAVSFPGTTTYYVDGVSGEKTINVGQWYHVVVTDTTGVSGTDFDIGRVTASYYTGILDSIRVYQRVLASAEISANYQAGNIEFQTRSGADNSPDDGSWEAWAPTTSETQILNMDSDASNWSWD